MVSRSLFLNSSLAGFVAYRAGKAAGAATAESATRLSLQVPLDHDVAGGPLIELPYFVVGTFDRSKPTVAVVADGQQFNVRADVLPTFRNSFGDGVNIAHALTQLGFTPSNKEAKRKIAEGAVRLNEQPVSDPGLMVTTGKLSLGKKRHGLLVR